MSRPGPGFPAITTDDGSTFLVVPAHTRLRWTEASAREAVAEVLGDLEARDALVRLAAGFGAPSGADDDEVLRCLVRALVDGALVAFEQPPPPPRGLPTVRQDPIAPPVRPTPTVTPAWVSFELLDHEGTPLGGRTLTFEHADRRLDSVTLDLLGRSPPIATTSAGGIHLEWPSILEAEPTREGPRAEGFVARADDLTIARRPVGSMRLGLNRHWRIVVAGPPRQPTTSFPSSVFASDSALPLHSVADLVTRAQETCDRDPRARVGVFAHSDMHGDAQSNKELADRRAEAVFALLTGDWSRFEQALAGASLPDDLAQAVLRALGRNPAAIDGEPGQQTALAVRGFRRAYNRDAWHADVRPRAYADLPDGDALDEPTRRALLDAYHAEYSGRLDPARFLGPRHAGCGEFNPRGSKNADNRRVTLVVYGDDAPAPLDFPCRKNDAGACKIDGGAGSKAHFTCKFYRDHVDETDVDHELTPFWDLVWLRTHTGKAHLSALTHLPDTNDATFVVSVAPGGGQPSDDSGMDGAPPDVGVVVAKLPGLIRRGVAYALWDAGSDYDPFDQRHWFRLPSEARAGAWLAPYMPPIFAIVSGTHWGISEGPGFDLPKVRFSQAPPGAVLALRASGRLVLVPGHESLPTAERARTTAVFAAGREVLLTKEDAHE